MGNSILRSIAGLEPLSGEALAAVESFGREMAEVVIPGIVRDVERRRALADESRLRILRKGRTVHYRNGREAKPGDRVFNLATGHSGMVYNLTAGSTTCNGRLAQVSSNDAYINLNECIHLDDVASAFPKPAS